MSENFAQMGSALKSGTDRASWCYVSGRVTVMEAELLGRSFFEGLLACESVAEARVVLAKTPYRHALGADDQIARYDEALAAFEESVAADISDASPPHVIKDFLHLRKNYRTFRNVFIRGSERGASAEELDNAFSLLGITPEEGLSLPRHRAALWDHEPPQAADAAARSLFLDSAACTVLLALAELAREEAIAVVLRDIALLQCWAAVLRSRLNGTLPEVIQRWFLVPEEQSGLVGDTARLATAEAANAVSGQVSEAAAEGLRAIGKEAILRNADAAAQEAIFRNALALRALPFGPEKVLAYMIAFGVEQANMRVSLASVVHGVERQAAAEALRREYA